MEYQDTKETDKKGMVGDEFKALDNRALMDALEMQKMQKDGRDEMDMMRRRHMKEKDIIRKPRKLTLVQFHCYKVQEEPIEIIMTQIPPRNFHEMRRQLREKKRGLADLEKEHKVQKFMTLYINVNEKEFANELMPEDL